MRTSVNFNPAVIKVVGVGGGGCNAIRRMVQEPIPGVEYLALNTDAQALAMMKDMNIVTKVQIGAKLTKGLGCGGDPVVGARAAEETREELRQALAGSDMIFVTAGMGGGTGTGGIPVVAEVAKQTGALTIAIVTKPFTFEGLPRKMVSDEGIAKLDEKVDTVIIIPNDRLLTLCDSKVLVQNAFLMADNVLRQGVRAIAEVITVPGEINLDFADVKAVMKDAGPAWLSIGEAKGQNRAIDAAKAAIASPMLDTSIEGAKGVLFTVTGGSNLTLHEVNEAAEVIDKAVDPEAKIIFGVTLDAKMEESVRITLIATGFSARLGVTSAPSDEEMNQLVRGLQDESQLEIPAFMRRPSALRRTKVIAPEPKKVGVKLYN